MVKHHNHIYWEGHKAYIDSGSKAECPFAMKTIGESKDKASKRQDWWDGFLDAQSDNKLGYIFDKYGMKRMIDT